MSDDLRANTRPVQVREGAEADFDAIEPLWLALYMHQAEKGMLLRPADGAFPQWVASMRPALGRFACLFVASSGSETVGFLAGRLRPIPAYWGGGQAGYVSDVYVSDLERGRGIGKLLLDVATHWFREREVRRLELHVVRDNEGAKRFYAREGWVEELVQMVLDINDNG